MTVSDALELRRAVPSFDSSVEISQEEILALIDKASLAPSSMNLQPWKFIVCHSAEDKARLQVASYRQKKISESSATIVVLGDLHQHNNAERVAESNIAHGYFGPERKEGFIKGAHNNAHNPQAQRDEAFRGGSLWAMSFMLVAKEAGWDTAPMGGYEADKVIAEFNLPENLIPVLVIGLGKVNPSINMLPRNDRFPASETARFGNWS